MVVVFLTKERFPYLWSNVVWSATEGGCGDAITNALFAHSKVCQLAVPLVVQQHIVQLQVPKMRIFRVTMCLEQPHTVGGTIPGLRSST